ncbi:MAG: NAD-binding protein [Gallionella sp.]
MELSELQRSNVLRNLLIAIAALWVVLLIGTVGYRVLGGPAYSWLDCFYMAFITISTIGYTEAVDVTGYEYGRLFTVFIAISGIGVLGYVLSTFTAFMLESDLNVAWRRKKMQKKIEKLHDHYIVCGVGRVGSNIAHELAMTGRPFVLIDASLENIESYLAKHPEQLYLHGDATDNDVLLAAGLGQARGIFAVAHDDTLNLVICLSARQLNAKIRIVARCHDMKNEEKTRRAGADEIVSPDFTGGLRLVSAMVRPQVVSFLDEMLKSDENLRMEEIIVPVSFSGNNLQALSTYSRDYMLLATRKPLGKWLFNPRSDHQVEDGDVLMVMATPQGRTALERLLTGAV